MHLYLKSIGFSEIDTRDQLYDLIRDVVEHHDEKFVINDAEDGQFVEYIKYYADGCGISVCGSLDKTNQFHVEFHYPLFRGNIITTQEPVTVERFIANRSYAGACDDLRVGVTLIFFLQSPVQFMIHDQGKESVQFPLTITGLAREGTILLPLEKDKEAVRAEKELSKARNELIAAAMDGDEDAMESLTMEDMDTYSMISERIGKEDVLSIVDSYFMPYGLECDQYNMLGEIVELESIQNQRTKEWLYLLRVECNDILFDICINQKDLWGEPMVGRRFKGIIWLQGQLHHDQ